MLNERDQAIVDEFHAQRAPRVIGTNWTGESVFQPRAMRNPNDQSHWRPTRRIPDRHVVIRRSRLAHYAARFRAFLNTPLYFYTEE